MAENYKEVGSFFSITLCYKIGVNVYVLAPFKFQDKLLFLLVFCFIYWLC